MGKIGEQLTSTLMGKTGAMGNLIQFIRSRFIQKLCLYGVLAIAIALLPMTIGRAEGINTKMMVMERGLEAEFETYFNRDLASVSQSPKDMAQTLAFMGEETDTNPAVMWVMPRQDHLRLILLTPDGKPIMRNLDGVAKEKIQASARRLTQSVTNPRRPFDQTTARELYRWILGPFEQEFLQPENIDTILFCLGDGLRGLPIAALHDGDRFLIEKYAVTRIPAFNLITHKYADIQRGELLAMGASEFKELNPLPAVPLELETIVRQLHSVKPATKSGQALSILNQDFTPEDFEAILSNRSFDIVHLATHADFVPGSPKESYIKFHNKKLTLDELPQFDWQKADVDLLVLSACKTAVGDSEAELGFAGLALQLGIDSAIASLWNISDAGTLALMADFYQELSLQPTKAEALRQAQLQLLKGNVQFDGDRLLLSRGGVVPIPDNLSTQIPPTQDLSHPYYWAGFSVISSPW